MRYLALASDYDGTLATAGRVMPSTIRALEQLRESGRKALLVTGRELPDLLQVFPHLDLFDRVVAENGGLLFNPSNKSERPLAEAPPEKFLRELEKRNVPFSVGRGIVATVEPHHTAALEVIKDLGLELQLTFNKGSVMILPSGVNKATGLRCALEELELSEHNVVAVGDAENDHAFLSACEFGVAVENALPMLKERADLVLGAPRGAGVEILIRKMIETDLSEYDDKLKRSQVLVGHEWKPSGTGEPVCVLPLRGSVLIAGPSGSGKSTAASGMLERFSKKAYQFCLIDPEGDYESFPDAIVLGTALSAPDPDEVIKAVSMTHQNVVVNLLGVAFEDRPLFFGSLFPRLLDLRSRTGRPHWLVLDEAHHLLPANWVPAPATLPQVLGGLVMITVHPDWIAKSALQLVSTAIAVGRGASETLSAFAKSAGITAPSVPQQELESGQAAVWVTHSKDVRIVKVEQGEMERRRHIRKYAEGELPPDRSFYFKGADGRLNLRAQNLNSFLQLADGVDDDTWIFHLNRGDYEQWFREFIKDPGLADETAEIATQHLSANDSRRRVRQAIENRYTAAA